MRILTAILFATGFSGMLSAENLSLRWDEVNNRLAAGRPVKAWLRDENQVSGRALEVKPEGLRMQITKVHGGRKYAPGETLLPASEIVKLHVNRSGRKGRIIGTAIGGTISGLIIVAAVAQADNEEARGSLAAGGLSATAIGYFLGWAKDYRVTKVEVIPAASKPGGPAPAAGLPASPDR